MIFIDIGSIILAAVFFLLFFASIFDSSLQVYGWLESNIIFVMIFFMFLVLPNLAKYFSECEKKNIIPYKKDVAIEIISHIIFMASIFFYIKDMAALYDAHPIVTAMCSIPSMIIISIIILYKISFLGIESIISIAVIIVSGVLLIVSLLPEYRWGTKLLIEIITASVVTLGIGIMT
ncbi:MAG: hypothetical protein IJB74_03100 [Clostridia bacterium]|nr:hypothetical protein [Clostridia bacterium]